MMFAASSAAASRNASRCSAIFLAFCRDTYPPGRVLLMSDPPNAPANVGRAVAIHDESPVGGSCRPAALAGVWSGHTLPLRYSLVSVRSHDGAAHAVMAS